MIKLLKNFQTKKQLREENEKLKTRIDALLYAPQPIGVERYELKTINSRVGVFNSQETESQKSLVAYRLAGEILPYIDFNIKDTNEPLFDKIITGTIQLAVKKRGTI